MVELISDLRGEVISENLMRIRAELAAAVERSAVARPAGVGAAVEVLAAI